MTLGLGSFDISTEDCDDGSCDGGGDGTSRNAVLVLRSKAGVSGDGDGCGAVRFRLSQPEELQEVCKVIRVQLIATGCEVLRENWCLEGLLICQLKAPAKIQWSVKLLRTTTRQIPYAARLLFGQVLSFFFLLGN